jgi:hypothetical protein
MAQALLELWDCNAYLRRMLDLARSGCDRDGVIHWLRRVAVSSSAPSLQDDRNDESTAHQPELATPQFRPVLQKAYPYQSYAWQGQKNSIEITYQLGGGTHQSGSLCWRCDRESGGG